MKTSTTTMTKRKSGKAAGEKDARALREQAHDLARQDIGAFKSFLAFVAALAAKYDRPQALAAGSSSPIAAEEMPREVEVAIARFAAELKESDDDDEGEADMRAYIAKHRAMPAPTLPPLTESDVAALCARYPVSSVDIYASRLFAEAVRAVTALEDDGDGDLLESFNYWLQVRFTDDTTLPPEEPAEERQGPFETPPPASHRPPTSADLIEAEAARRFLNDTFLSTLLKSVDDRRCQIRAQVEAEHAAGGGSGLEWAGLGSSLRALNPDKHEVMLGLVRDLVEAETSLASIDPAQQLRDNLLRAK